jgi:peptidoglycan/LPS O-acetylase OafA/YrhL
MSEGQVSIASTQREHLAWLDWMRFLASVVVLVTHVRQATFVDYASMDPASRTFGTKLFLLLGRLGEPAVMVFFVLSGFLVGGVVIERLRAGTFEPRTYAIDRIVRIATPLIPAMVFTIVVTQIRSGAVDYGQVLGNLFALQESFVPTMAFNAPLWSLAYEIWFYLLAGVVALLCLKKAIGPSLVVLAAGLLVFSRLHPAYLGIWCIGAVAYFWRPHRRLVLLALVGAAIAISGTALFQIVKESHAFHAINLNRSVPALVLGIGTAIFVCCVRSFACRAGLAKLGSGLAAPSYTLYLTHYPLICLLQVYGLERGQMALGSFVNFFGVIALSFIVAMVFYFPFERNTKAIKALIVTRTILQRARLSRP